MGVPESRPNNLKPTKSRSNLTDKGAVDVSEFIE